MEELREKLRKKIKLPKRAIDEIEALLRESTLVKKPKKHLGLKISDPNDEWIVASAVAGGADVLVPECSTPQLHDAATAEPR